MDGGLESSVATAVIVGRGGRELVGGFLGIVGDVFGVLEGIVQVWGGGELSERGEGAFDGEVWLLFVWGGGEGVCVGLERRGVLLRGGARVGSRGEGRALVVMKIMGGMGGGGCRVGGEEYVVGGKGLLRVESVVESVVEEGGIVGCVGEVVPVKVGGVVIAGQD